MKVIGGYMMVIAVHTLTICAGPHHLFFCSNNMSGTNKIEHVAQQHTVDSTKKN